MRLDLFLKTSGIIKRRTVSAEMISQGRVKLAGRTLKNAHEVKLNDEYEIHFGNRLLRIRVTDLSSKPPAYEVITQLQIPFTGKKSQG